MKQVVEIRSQIEHKFGAMRHKRAVLASSIRSHPPQLYSIFIQTSALRENICELQNAFYPRHVAEAVRLRLGKHHEVPRSLNFVGTLMIYEIKTSCSQQYQRLILRISRNWRALSTKAAQWVRNPGHVFLTFVHSLCIDCELRQSRTTAQAQ